MKNKKLKLCLSGLLMGLMVVGCTPKDPIDPVDPPIVDPDPDTPVVLTLKQMKENGINEINDYVDIDSLSESKVSLIENILIAYTAKINECKYKNDLPGIITEAKAKLDEVINSPDISNSNNNIYHYMNKKDHYDILMVGSSYLYYNDQYELLKNMLTEQGYDINIEHLTGAKAYLEYFVEEGNELKTQLDNLLSNDKYEYVFLDDVSTRPIKKPSVFEESVRKIKERVEETQSNCEIILFETWARDTRDTWYNENPGFTYDSLARSLANAYTNVANKFNMRVSYSGLSFQNVYNNPDLNINLYYTDYTHPSLYGSYLSALNHFNTLTGLSPEVVNYRPVDYNPTYKTQYTTISEDDANALKRNVINRYSNTYKEIKIIVWNSNASSIFYTDEELKEIKLNFAAKLQSNVIYTMYEYKNTSKANMTKVATLDIDYDVILAGSNMDTDLGFSIVALSGYEKALVHSSWVVDTNRYVGISSKSKDKELAKSLRDMLIGKHLTDTKNVLFIGNSYTFYNDMYIMFKEICESMGFKVNSHKVTLGSRALTAYSNNDETTQELIDKLDKVDFDYVFMQEQSTKPLTNYSGFKTGVQVVANLLKSHGDNANAKIVLYNTWARKTGSSWYNDNSSYDYNSMSLGLYNAYKNCANSYGYDVSYCGIGMHYMHTRYKNIEVYHTDYTHPNPNASYMIALIHANKVFGINPKEVTYIPNFDKFMEGNCPVVMPTQSQAVVLREAAYVASYQFADYSFTS